MPIWKNGVAILQQACSLLHLQDWGIIFHISTNPIILVEVFLEMQNSKKINQQMQFGRSFTHEGFFF